MLLLIVIGFHCDFTSYFVFLGTECKFLSVCHCTNVLLWSGCALVSYFFPTTSIFPFTVRFDQLYKHKHLTLRRRTTYIYICRAVSPLNGRTAIKVNGGGGFNSDTKELNCTEGELICETAGLPWTAAPSCRRSCHTDVSWKSTQQDHAAATATTSEASRLCERTAAVSALPAEACALW